MDLKYKGEYVRGRARNGHEVYKFRIPKSALDDQVSKEKGYKRALELNLEFLINVTDPDISRQSINEIIKSLKRITQEDFDDIDSWIIWWEENRDKLVLSDDGTKLVIK